MRVISTGARAVDWDQITSGTAQYADDLRFPDALVGGILRSPHAHARIVAIDVDRAKQVPGVRAVLTGSDLPERQYLDYRPTDSDRYPLARDVVRHVGEPVAVVAADDPGAVSLALAAIEVKYRLLPAETTIERALGRRAATIHDDRPGNVVSRVRREYGDQQLARGTTTHSFMARYVSSRQTHATMEPHTALAHWRPDEAVLHMWVPTQNPRKLQADIAHVLGLKLAEVRLHEVAIGGDFGGRAQISSSEVLVGALSMATGRPVKLAHDRHDEFAFTKSRFLWDIRLRLGCDNNGKLTLLNADFDVENGAYNLSGPGEMEYGSIALGSSYRWLSYTSSGRCVYTNRQAPSSFRGAGGFQVNWALECAIDELADQIGIDPIDFRLANAVSEVNETTITGWEVSSSRLRDCLKAVREQIGWDEKRTQGGGGRGVGVACSIHVTSLHRRHLVTSSAALDLSASGELTLRTGCGDAGTGQKTLAVQAVAEILEIPLDTIRVISLDTLETPVDAGAGASRGTYNTVSAARKVAKDLRRELSDVAALKFGISSNEVEWVDGGARHGEDHLSIEDLLPFLSRDGEYTIESEYVGPYHDEATDGYEDLAPSYSFAAHAVEVDVDQDTGKVTVVRVVAAHDSGTIINTNTARGQVEGGVLMGLGAAMGEELILEEGQVVNPAYVDYPLPRSTDAPHIDTVFLETDDPGGPFGAKGLGEIVLLPTGAALVNAVSHAVGVRIREAPLTPDRVLMALRARDGKPLNAGRQGGSLDRLWISGMRRAYPLGLHKALQKVGPMIKATPPAGEVTEVLRPESLQEAQDELATPGVAPMGGGTDLLVLGTQGLPVASTVVHVSRCPELTQINVNARGDLLVGGAVTLEALESSEYVNEAIRQTVRSIATPQIRSVATVAGNLCQTKRCWFYRNGFDCYKRSGYSRPCYAVQGDHRFYHAVAGAHRCQAVTPSDLATSLIALDARLDVVRSGSDRVVNLEDLYSGPGETTLAGDELISGVRIPHSALTRRTVYKKLSLWQGAFAMVTVAVSGRMDSHGAVEDLRIVCGSVSPTPSRLREVEAILEGRRPTPELLREAAQFWLNQTNPLPGNHWKAFAAENLLRSTLSLLLEES